MWSHQTSSGSSYHKISLQSPESYTEMANQAQDGTAYYAMANVRILFTNTVNCAEENLAATAGAGTFVANR